MIHCTFENGSQTSLRHVTAGALIIRGGSLLLARRAPGLLEAGKWCLPGGFINRDESIQQGIVREIREETGYEVRDMTLFRINDNPMRPHEDRQNVDFIFLCSAEKQIGKMDWETVDIQWFELDSLPASEHIAFDHLDSIIMYKSYQERRFAIPFVGQPLNVE